MRRRVLTVMLLIVVSATLMGSMWYFTTPAPFMMQVTSRPSTPSSPSEAIQSFAGQRCVFLVVVTEEEGWLQGHQGFGTAVTVSAAESSGRGTVIVHPQELLPEHVAEVTVIPSVACVNETLTVTIMGERGGLKRMKTITIEVLAGEDGLAADAVQMRDQFIPWLTLNHPELGITDETEWSGTIVNPRILVVMHYLFFSDDWEMYVTWHVTIPPNDWTRIYLRQRFIELQPSYAFEVSSVMQHATPHAIDVPDWV